MRRPTTLTIAALGVLLLGACGQEDPTVDADPDETTAEEVDGALDGAEDAGDDGDPGGVGSLEEATEIAIADLVASAGATEDDVEVVTAEDVTWSDGSLGCPDPDMMYTQALVPGYRIVLALAGDEVHYHGAEGEAPKRCADPEPPADAGS